MSRSLLSGLLATGIALTAYMLLGLTGSAGVPLGPLTLSAAEPSVSPSAAPAPLAPTPTPAEILEALPTAFPTETPTLPPTATPTLIPTPNPRQVTNVPVLMYHYIRELPPNTPDQLGYGLSIAPKLFDQELSYIAAAGYHTVTMGQLADHMTKGTPLPSKPIVLSFDDGYADFYTAAYPLLQRYHLGATAYIVVDFVGKPGYVSWQQLAELRDSGIEIGAHTLDHVDLAIQNLPTATRQIQDSGLILRQRLGVPVTTFAYPSGRYNTGVVRVVGESGFTSAVTTNFGARYTTSELLTLPRIRVSGGISMPNFIRNLSA